MNDALYDARMRKVSAREDAFFEEIETGGTRAFYCLRPDIPVAFGTQHNGQAVRAIGDGALVGEMEVEGLRFEFVPGPLAWFHQGGEASLSLLPTCALQSAAQWIRAFNALGDSRGHHFIGAESTPPPLVALADRRSVTWFNHRNGFLWATELAAVTRGGTDEVDLGNLIRHASRGVEPCLGSSSPPRITWLPRTVEVPERVAERVQS